MAGRGISSGPFIVPKFLSLARPTRAVVDRTLMIYRATFPTSDGIYTVDVIEHDGEFWFVPEWIDNPAKGTSSPARIVRLNSVPHRKHLGAKTGDFSIPFGVPKALIFGPYPSTGQPQLDRVEAPDIQVVRRIH